MAFKIHDNNDTETTTVQRVVNKPEGPPRHPTKATQQQQQQQQQSMEIDSVPTENVRIVYKKPPLTAEKQAHMQRMNEIRKENAKIRREEKLLAAEENRKARQQQLHAPAAAAVTAPKQQRVAAAVTQSFDDQEYIDRIVSQRIAELERKKQDKELAEQERLRHEQSLQSVIDSKIESYIQRSLPKQAPRRPVEKPQPIPKETDHMEDSPAFVIGTPVAGTINRGFIL